MNVCVLFCLRSFLRGRLRQNLCPKHLFSLRHFILSQTAITSASHPLFNEQNKFWQLTYSLSPSNTSILICWWLGPTVPPFPPGRFVFVFIILQLSQMTVISWIGDTYWRSQPITRRRKGRLFVAFTNRTVWARESLQTCHNFMH